MVVMKRLALAAGTLGILFAMLGYAFGFGYLAGSSRQEFGKAWRDRAWRIVRSVVLDLCNEGDRTACGFSETSGRQAVSCTPFTGAMNSRNAILFAFGQSNSANSGEVRHVSREGVVNFNLHDGRCYHAEDPLLGAAGERGSVWTRVGDRLVESGRFERVLIVPFGIGGTEIARWAPGGDLFARVEHAALTLGRMGIQPTHVVWHQGEADVNLGTRAADYERMFGELLAALRDLGITAPVYPAVASLCRNLGSDAIRSAQRALSRRYAGVYPGPDSDSLDRIRQRHDLCHFSEAGLSDHAALWVDALLAQQAEVVN